VAVVFFVLASFVGRMESEEGIDNPETSEELTVLEILGKEQIGLHLDSGRDDQ
jgi:hypothetical protein